ncbi:MAG: hypothetical protein IJA69_01270 [Clostridia bacterium]|nr:hypothetical protein [Clostridia bacterium]
MFGKRIRQLKESVKYKKPEHYYEINDENQAIINVGAENFDDVFSPYCYKGGDSLSSELVAYLEEKAEGIPLEYDLVIRFHVKNASDSKREEIEKALRTNFRNDIQGIKRQLKRNDAFSLAFFGIGMILFMLYMFLPEGTNKIVMGFLELFAWVMAWEALDAFFLDRRSMQIERLKKYRLWASKVEIIEFENY